MEVDLTNVKPDPELRIARANAIEAYADLEQSLCMLFAALLRTSPEKAGAVFFRLTNTSSRNDIFESLLRMEHGERYDAYWHGIKNSPSKFGLFTLIRQLDTQRNEVVHWHVHRTIHFEGDSWTTFETLAKPNFWDRKETSPELKTEALWEIMRRANFASKAVSKFFEATATNLPMRPERDAWLRIFQQPIAYPPPDTHPLSRNWKEPQSPPEPSQG